MLSKGVKDTKGDSTSEVLKDLEWISATEVLQGDEERNYWSKVIAAKAERVCMYMYVCTDCVCACFLCML